MSGGFLDRVDRIVKQSDIVLEILDARFPEMTRNRILEQSVVRKGKKLILVLNKSDLLSKRLSSKIKKELKQEFPVVFVSATEKKGSGFLRVEIGKASKGEKCVVSVVGFPNTGKSSVINMLSGRHSARTSPKAGFTRGEQLIRVSEKITVFDTPGVIPYREHDSFKLVVVGSKNIDQVHDAENIGIKFMDWLKLEYPESLKEWGLNPELDAETLLEDYARKKNRLLKGGLPDTKTASFLLIQAWQRGKLKL